MIIISVGAAFLARQAGLIMPSWLFTWEMLLIVIGIYTICKHSFRRIGGGLTLIAIGSVFLIDNFYPDLSLGQFFWPVFIIIIGLWVMFKPRNYSRSFSKKMRYERWRNRHGYSKTTDSSIQSEIQIINSDSSKLADVKGEFIDITTIFSGNQRKIFSRNFKGGEVLTVFGGTELNLMQAEIEGNATLEITTVFGGIKLIVPPHWQVRTEMVSFFGGIEDKRYSKNEGVDLTASILTLRGPNIFGGINIKSY